MTIGQTIGQTIRTKEHTVEMATKEDSDKIVAVATRASEILTRANVPHSNLAIFVDLELCHANGCPLDLDAMMICPEEVLIHDVIGISRFVDRETGELFAGFLPAHVLAPSPVVLTIDEANKIIGDCGQVNADLVDDSLWQIESTWGIEVHSPMTRDDFIFYLANG